MKENDKRGKKFAGKKHDLSRMQIFENTFTVKWRDACKFNEIGRWRKIGRKERKIEDGMVTDTYLKIFVAAEKGLDINRRISCQSRWVAAVQGI